MLDCFQWELEPCGKLLNCNNEIGRVLSANRREYPEVVFQFQYCLNAFASLYVQTVELLMF